MPRTDVQRDFRDKLTYHVYNRGVNKANIFLDKDDYWFFRRSIRRSRKKFGINIKFRQYSLLPTHFHFVIYQANKDDITRFMISHLTRFSRYICQKYHYSGPLYESRYKAKPLYTKWDIQHAIEYVANNPRKAGLPANWKHVGVNP
jgi:putative transposase